MLVPCITIRDIVKINIQKYGISEISPAAIYRIKDLIDGSW